MRKTIEHNLKSGIFASRWLLAPFYAGLSISLLLLLMTFFREFMEFIPSALHSEPSYVIVTVLSLVDIVMVAESGASHRFRRIRDFRLEDRHQR